MSADISLAQVADAAWTAQQIEQFRQTIVDLKFAAVADNDLGPVAQWQHAGNILLRWLHEMYPTVWRPNGDAAYRATGSHVHDLWRAVTTLTAKLAATVDAEGGDGRVIVECSNLFSEAMGLCPSPPEVSRLGIAWVKALSEIGYSNRRSIATGAVTLEPAAPTEPRPKYSPSGGQWLMVVPDDPPPYEISVEGPDGRRQVIQMGAKPLKFGHMIVLLDDLKLLFDRFRESSTSATQDDINRLLGLLYSDPGFERFRDWANIEFGRHADADAAHELQKRLSTKLRIPFDTLGKMPVVEVMRLVDEHLAVSPASEGVTPETPEGEPASATWTPERIERFVEAIEALKRDAMAHRDLGPVAEWGDGCSILFRWLGALFVIRDHENWRAVLAASYSHVVDLWQSVITLTSRVATVTEVAGGNARTIIECGNMFTETISALPRPPDMSRLGPAWGKAVNELVYLGQRAALAATSKPADGEPAAVAASGERTPSAALNFNLPGRSAVSASAAEDDAMALVRMGLNLSKPPAAAAASGTEAKSSSNTKRKSKRGPRKLSKVQKALVILKYRAKNASESIRVEDIAIEADCTPQNLYKSLEFQKEWESARARRIRRGWKVEGVADSLDESTLDVG